MTLAARSLTLFPDAGGVISSVRPEPTPDVIWGTVPDYENQEESTAFSVDVRAGFMSGTGAATAVITIEDVSGDTASTLGLSISGSDNLATAAGTVGAGVFRLVATYNSVAYRSNTFAFSVVAAASPDAQAPTAPLIVGWSAASTTQIDLTILPPCDPKTPVSDADGMDTIDIYRNVSGGSYSLLTQKSISAGISIQMAANTIGTHGVSPSSTQTGASWEVTAEGVNGIDDTDPADDEIYFIAGNVSGDFDLSCKIPDYTSPTGSKTAGQLMVRESVGVDSKFISNGRLANVGSAPDPIYSEVKFRNATGGGVQYANPQNNLSGDHWFRINRTGDLFTCYIWKEGQQSWVLNQTQTIVMNSAVLAGMFVNSGLAATTATVDFENVCLQNLALVTHSDTGLTASTTYGYKCKGVDLA